MQRIHLFEEVSKNNKRIGKKEFKGHREQSPEDDFVVVADCLNFVNETKIINVFNDLVYL